MGSASRHQCLIYVGAPSGQLPTLATMIKRKLGEGYQCLYLNSSPMVAGVRSCLAAIGIEVQDEVSRGRLILSSEPTAAADGNFNADLMLHDLEEALDQALRDGYAGLWATGDMTWEYGAERNYAKLLDYEYRLERLMQRRPQLCGICRYHRDTLPPDAIQSALLTHQTLFLDATHSRANPDYVPSRAA
jgi:hypothetical protein